MGHREESSFCIFGVPYTGDTCCGCEVIESYYLSYFLFSNGDFCRFFSVFFLFSVGFVFILSHVFVSAKMDFICDVFFGVHDHCFFSFVYRQDGDGLFSLESRWLPFLLLWCCFLKILPSWVCLLHNICAARPSCLGPLFFDVPVLWPGCILHTGCFRICLCSFIPGMKLFFLWGCVVKNYALIFLCISRFLSLLLSLR